MRISERIEHPATPDRVYAMVTDPDYQRARCERSGALSHEVALEQEADTLTVVTRRQLPTTELPDAVRTLVGQHVNLVETTRWGPALADGTREGALLLDVEGTPVGLVGGVHLQGNADGTTTYTVDGDLDAHVPLLGGRIERSAAPMIGRALQIEQDLGRQWLADR